MSRISMSPDELEQIAKDYGEASRIIIDMLTKLNGTQNKLEANWEGKAFQKFDQQFESLKPKVEEFSDLMLEIEKQLIGTAQAVREHDEQLSQNFGFN